MKKTKVESDPTVVETYQKDELKSLYQDAKRLRLTNDTNDFELTNLTFIDLKKELNTSRFNQPAAINEIFDLVGHFYSNLNSKVNSQANTDAYMNSFLSFLLEKIEYLFSVNHESATRTDSQPVEILTKLLLQLINKHFNPALLKTYNPHFFDFLKRTRNNKLIVEIFNLWFNSEQNLFSIKNELLPYLKRNLKNNDHRIRSKCLGIIALHYNDHEVFEDKSRLLKILLNFTDDQDPRVRVTALESLIMLHIKGICITTNYFDDLKLHLNDDFETVRILSIHLLFLLASTYPEFLIKIEASQDEEQLRLVDDVFARICNMINDISVEVKVCANNLLGKMKYVSSGFLVQTLDKNLMSDLKMKKNRQRLKQLVTSEWSATFTATGADSTITEEDNLNLMSSGACGAFIHGLEDECLEVRSEAVEALCNLAIDCPELAAKSIDFLVDMFNDEIEMVRLKAIRGLTKIAHYVLLGDDQVDIVLSVIEDYSMEVREALKDLLSNCKLATKIGLKKATQALFKNLRKYSFDKYSIWKCFMYLGINHSKFVMSLVSYLIGLHPFLDVTEPDMNDVFYTGSLILIYNGCAKNSAILPLLPKFVINHYFFLKLKLPDLVPAIKLIETFPITIVDPHVYSSNKKNRIQKFFQNIIENLKITSEHADNTSNGMKKILDSLSNDMVYLSETDPTTSTACEIMKTFIECYMVKYEISYNNKFQSSIDCDRLIQIEKALMANIKLLLLYRGYSTSEKLILFKTYLFLRGYYLKEHYDIKSSMNSNSFLRNSIMNSYLMKSFFKQDLVKQCSLYLRFIRLFEGIEEIESNEFLAKIIDNMSYYETNPLSLIELLNSPLFSEFRLDLLILGEEPERYVKSSLELIEPVDNHESPIRFTPGLICSIKVKITLQNFIAFDNLYIQIIYSDKDKQFIPIELSSIQKLNKSKHLIDTSINLSNLAWTDVCYVKLSIVMLKDEYGDFEEDVVKLTGKEFSKTVENVNKNSRTYRSQCDIVELSNTVKIYFEPSLNKKFIHV